MKLSAEKTKIVYIPNDPDEGYIKIRELSDHEISECESEASETLFTDGGMTVSVNGFKRANKIALACLIGWGNLFDVNGETLKFNPQNKLKVAKFSITVENKSLRFYEWVENEHSKYLEEIEQEKIEASKN